MNIKTDGQTKQKNNRQLNHYCFAEEIDTRRVETLEDYTL